MLKKKQKGAGFDSNKLEEEKIAIIDKLLEPNGITMTRHKKNLKLKKLLVIFKVYEFCQVNKTDKSVVQCENVPHSTETLKQLNTSSNQYLIDVPKEDSGLFSKSSWLWV